MSDFYSIFWDYYVAILTIVSVVGCSVFLWLQGKRKVVLVAGKDPETTGHVWDGDLREFHNPMPRWWILLFHITVIFSVIYLILYPGLGTQFKGLLGWSSGKQHADEVKAADSKFGPVLAAYLKQPLEKVAADARARQMGERIFLNNCAQCHGSDARGARGFPNLADGVSYWGATPEAIKESIVNGRVAAMPPMAAAIGTADDVTDVAHYVLSLSNSAHDSVRAGRGKEKFVACAACHGPEGKGNPALGARDLTQKGWIYGQTVNGIVETVTKGRGGVMPSFKGVLSEAEIHLAAAYVYGLAGGGGTAPAASAQK